MIREILKSQKKPIENPSYVDVPWLISMRQPLRQSLMASNRSQDSLQDRARAATASSFAKRGEA
jgi:hypothetical protein